MASKKCDLLVIGGGSGGLVLALELARKGYEIAILDQKASPMSFPRGEILQPNGLKILDQLGLLEGLLKADIHLNKMIHFYKMSGQQLCTIDYTRLPDPYAYSLMMLPGILQEILLEKINEIPNIEIFWGTSFNGLLRKSDRISGAEASHAGKPFTFQCPMVVGGDGAGSKVRESFQISHRLHTYSEGYITMIVDRPKGFHEDSRYYLGKKTIFGAFPISKNRLYLFYLIREQNLEKIKGRGIDPLKTEILAIHPEIEALFSVPLKEISSWDKTAYMRCFRVRCDRWVVNGGVLLGDAAHAMNPHVAQGRNAAMEDGIMLAHVLETCFKSGYFSQEALSRYEKERRPDIDILQALGDEMVFFWNSGLPPLVWLRDRVFKKVHHRSHLHDKLLKTVAGLDVEPFRFVDRLDAVRP